MISPDNSPMPWEPPINSEVTEAMIEARELIASAAYSIPKGSFAVGLWLIDAEKWLAKYEAAMRAADNKDAGDGWLPIETHLGHCAAVLVCRETPTEQRRATSAFMDATGVWRLYNSEGGMTPLPFDPTHWQPLPAPPRADQSNGGE